MIFDKLLGGLVLTSRKVNFWSFKTQEEITTSHEHPVVKVMYNSEFLSLVSCDQGSNVFIWD
jgi:hypothetical protein